MYPTRLPLFTFLNTPHCSIVVDRLFICVGNSRSVRRILLCRTRRFFPKSSKHKFRGMARLSFCFGVLSSLTLAIAIWLLHSISLSLQLTKLLIFVTVFVNFNNSVVSLWCYCSRIQLHLRRALNKRLIYLLIYLHT